MRTSKLGQQRLPDLARCGEGMARDHEDGHLDSVPGVGIGINLCDAGAKQSALVEQGRDGSIALTRNVAQMRTAEMKGDGARIVGIVLFVDQDQLRLCLQLFDPFRAVVILEARNEESLQFVIGPDPGRLLLPEMRDRQRQIRCQERMALGLGLTSYGLMTYVPL